MEFDAGWTIIQGGISQIKAFTEGELGSTNLTTEDFTQMHFICYKMCNNGDYCTQLYGKYRETLKDYLCSAVLPSLRNTPDGLLPAEFVRRWKQYKKFVGLLNLLFGYLNRYYISHRSLPALKEVAMWFFFELGFNPIRGRMANAMLMLNEQERVGEQIDPSILKQLFDILVEIGVEDTDHVLTYKSILQL